MSTEPSQQSENFQGYRWTFYSELHGFSSKVADRVLKTAKWDALIQRATEKRSGMKCRLLPAIGMGYNHMIRILEFADRVQWVARLQMPDLYDGSAKAQGEMECEHMTFRLVQEKTKIPVPKIHVCEDGPSSSAGVPFMLMDCLRGNVGADLALIIPHEHEVKVYTAMAEAHIEMFNIKLSQIGRIVGENNDGSYRQGPIPGIGGPFDTAAEYFRAWATHTKFRLTPDQLRALSGKYADELSVNNTCPFGLYHGDFGHANVVFDDNYRMLGVIDWELAYAALCEIAAQFPLAVPGTVPTLDFSQHYDDNGDRKDADLKKGYASRERYIAIVKQIEEEQGFTTGYRLSSALESSQRHHMACAIPLFEDGRAAFYSKVMEGFCGDE
ncbi:phosphotransferase family protein [Aspergillus ibericus CBS 121593]|uniref:Aminoglycoside phosphotransferase domain-containing protein n=1 Tax=Aspergillus ibericus CBS 121593 TaxID=1448316 RepID=A0A395GHE9_9EURO|nr:hypothetical protein BO80DRAFT_471255 [Aspergillus ibericus CBS 121593]RAK94811.1 hypothetical protein BO80DRAFT_471255 [Aspergillus ibericus CBS 121593]